MWTASGFPVVYQYQAHTYLPNINPLGYYPRMEKHTPHCRLSVVKALLEAGKVRSTLSALAGGAALGFDFADMLDVINALKPSDFKEL